MNLFRSLKIRIAATVFLLELILLPTVLWQTQSVANERAKQQVSTQDNTIVQLLSEVSHVALLTTEYSEVSPQFDQAAENPHIMEIHLYDERERIIASSNLQSLGKDFSHETTDPDTYWLRHPIEGASDQIGALHVKFSDKELKAAYKESLTLGLSIAAIGMTAILLAGLLMGHILTRRLRRVMVQTKQFAAGDLNARADVKGDDEITDLASAFNDMASQVSCALGRFEQLAYHDSLTGLANRTSFDQRLNTAVESAHSENREHALLYIDLDQFKIVNDTCGHDAGDQLLVELAQALAKRLRSYDDIARLGGDEFGVLLEDCDIDEAYTVAEKIRTTAADFRFTWNDQSFRIGVSIGLVPITINSGTSKQVLSHADIACYTAKDMGRNAIRIARDSDEDIQLRAKEMQWVSRIQQAIEKRQFIVHQQPIANTRDTSKRPFREYLLRLRDNGERLVYPGSFLPAAERFGLMPALDRYTVDLVMQHLEDLPFEQRPEVAFINLSGASLGDPGLYDHISDALRRHRLKPSSVCFEITETAAVNNFGSASEFVKQLRALGCRFALDDFGSGMCSFTYLKLLPADFVKIDGSFIRNIRSEAVDRSIVTAINEIAHAAHFETIAEFVEDEATLRQLEALDVDYVQGYGIERPGSVDRLTSAEPIEMTNSG